jgi:hypothetical protein
MLSFFTTKRFFNTKDTKDTKDHEERDQASREQVRRRK